MVYGAGVMTFLYHTHTHKQDKLYRRWCLHSGRKLWYQAGVRCSNNLQLVSLTSIKAQRFFQTVITVLWHVTYQYLPCNTALWLLWLMNENIFWKPGSVPFLFFYCIFMLKYIVIAQAHVLFYLKDQSIYYCF